MAPILSLLSPHEIASHFDAGSMRRAHAYAEDGSTSRPDILSLDEHHVVANAYVSGSARTAYVVRLEAESDGVELDLQTLCNCPVRFQCKHGAALALVLGEALDEVAEEELRRRGPDRIVVAGSTGQVSAAIEGVLAGIAPTSRVDVDDPVELAAGVARTLADRADRVVVATADRFPDALAAGVLGIPVLLTAPTALSATCRQAIVDLGASSVVIAGGPAAVSEDVAAELTGQGLAVTRVAGPDRIATAAAFARTAGLRTTAYAASATRFPDALSAGIAARRDGMLVLVDDTGATAVTDQLLADAQVDRIRIVGGEAAVGLAAEATLAAHL